MLLLSSFDSTSVDQQKLEDIDRLAREPREARRNISSARSAELIARQNIYRTSTSNLSRAKRGVIASKVSLKIKGKTQETHLRTGRGHSRRSRAMAEQLDIFRIESDSYQ